MVSRAVSFGKSHPLFIHKNKPNARIDPPISAPDPRMAKEIAAIVDEPVTPKANAPRSKVSEGTAIIDPNPIYAFII